jgi:hypothetical protein
MCEDDEVKNLYLSKCNEFPSLIKTIIETDNNFVIPAATAADPVALKTFIQAALVAGIATRIYLWPDFDTVENQAEAKVRVQRATGRTVPVRDGLQRWLFGVSQNLCLHIAMFTHRRRGGRAILIDINNKYFATKNSDGDVQGFAISLLDTDNIKFNDGANPSESPIFLELADPNEMNKNGIMGDASFVSSLDRLTDVVIEQVSGSTTKIVVKVTQPCDGVEVAGLVVGDFVLKTTSGTTQTISSVTSVAGVYTLNGTGLATGTLALVAPASLSIQAYELAGGPVVVTVPFP